MPADLTRLLCDPTRLTPWLDAQGLEGGQPLTVERITTGHSNETFLVRRGGSAWILRRPPRVPLAPTAHDMVRETRLLRALAGTAVPVPRLVAACADPNVLGASFHLTERLDGWVIRDRVPEPLLADAARPRVGEAFIDALVALHAADWRGRPPPRGALRSVGGSTSPHTASGPGPTSRGATASERAARSPTCPTTRRSASSGSPAFSRAPGRGTSAARRTTRHSPRSARACP